MKKFKLFAILSACILSESATAVLMIGAQSVDASVPDISPTFALQELINQDGLSANYVSGVTDFDSFVATTTHTSPSISSGGGWASSSRVMFPATIDFDLGTIYNLTALALWNDRDTQALGEFEVFSSTDNSYNSLVSLGAFTGSFTNADIIPGEVFDFSDISTQFIRIVGTPVKNDSPSDLLNIGEIAFGGELVMSVPEPSIASLLVFGMAGIWYSRKKKSG